MVSVSITFETETSLRANDAASHAIARDGVVVRNRSTVSCMATKDAAPPRARTEPIVIRSLNKRYGSFAALSDINLDIASGEFLTILGASGSGKSTLLMIIAGFLRATSGSLLFGTREMIRLPPHQRNLGVVFQNYALFPHMTVAENVAFPLRLRGYSRAEIAQRVTATLQVVRMPGYEDRRIEALSGGQRQRVALARAIVFEPPILLMDEPLSALDKNLREEMQSEIRDLHGRLGITTVYVTHDQREALTMSDRIAVIHQGRIQQVDVPAALYDSPTSAYVASFIGESTLLPVEVRGGTAYQDGRAIRTEAPVLDNGRPSYLILRPERLRPSVGSDEQDGWNVFEGTVHAIANHGDSILVAVRLRDGTLIHWRQLARSDLVALLPSIGATVTLGLHARESVIVQGE